DGGYPQRPELFLGRGSDALEHLQAVAGRGGVARCDAGDGPNHRRPTRLFSRTRPAAGEPCQFVVGALEFGGQPPAFAVGLGKTRVELLDPALGLEGAAVAKLEFARALGLELRETVVALA